MYFSCSWRTMKMVSVVHTSARHKAKMHLIDVHHLANVEVQYPFQQLHDLIYEFETMIIATAKGFTFPLLRFITKLSSQSYEITLQLKTASASCFVSSTPSSPAAFSISPVPQISINSPYSKSGKSYGWEYWDSAFCGKKRRKREKIIMEKKRRKKRKFSPYSFPLFLHIIGSIETPLFMEESREKADIFSIFISAFCP